mmetsp:Transcript_11748/g.22352  ORF Transcript_11748/g.22352 Transcript_11748/m.22352 type:complete len:465 (-) Transcript_11748:126-1520(-)
MRLVFLLALLAAALVNAKNFHCKLSGDPHVTDFSGQKFNHYRSGTFTAFRKGKYKVQTRQGFSTTWKQRSTIQGLIVSVGSKRYDITVDQRNCRRIGTLPQKFRAGKLLVEYTVSCRKRVGDRHFNVKISYAAKTLKGVSGTCQRRKHRQLLTHKRVKALAKRMCNTGWKLALREAHKRCPTKRHFGKRGFGCLMDRIRSLCVSRAQILRRLKNAAQWAKRHKRPHLRCRNKCRKGLYRVHSCKCVSKFKALALKAKIKARHLKNKSGAIKALERWDRIAAQCKKMCPAGKVLSKFSFCKCIKKGKHRRCRKRCPNGYRLSLKKFCKCVKKTRPRKICRVVRICPRRRRRRCHRRLICAVNGKPLHCRKSCGRNHRLSRRHFCRCVRLTPRERRAARRARRRARKRARKLAKHFRRSNRKFKKEAAKFLKSEKQTKKVIRHLGKGRSGARKGSRRRRKSARKGL